MPIRTGFTRNPLDRVDQYRRDPAALAALRISPAARFLVLDELKPLVRPDGSDLYWARRAEIAEGPAILLGLDTDGAPRFAVDAPRGDIDAVPTDARAIAATMDDGRAAIVAQARSVLDWHRRHGFCANCGAPTVMAKAGYGRNCASCNTEHFPRVDPVVIMLAERDDMALIGRQPQFPRRFYSALAGFVEAGESLEEAVSRELWEEAGIRTHDVRYLASQPWPYPSSLMIAAIAQADSFDLTLDRFEIEDARWVSRAEVKAALAGEADWVAPPPLAIAHSLLTAWAKAAL